MVGGEVTDDQKCQCGLKTGTHDGETYEPITLLCLDCLQAGCEPDKEKPVCLVYGEDGPGEF